MTSHMLEGLNLELTRPAQWVLWRSEKRDGKLTKVPYQVGGARASVTDPATWTTFEKALASVDRYRGVVHYDGLGFVLTAADPFVGVDLDHCRDRDTGALVAWAREIVDALNSYTEITPSAEGLRVFVRGALPPGGRKRGDVEMYDRARYLTVTGAHLPGTPTTIKDRTVELAAVHAKFLGAAAAEAADESGPAADADADLDDAALLERARRARNGAAFSRLWSGDINGYPSPSEADLALSAHLAFWTGRDAARIDRMFRRSGLFRAKWDERHGDSTYGERTIARAIAEVREVYNGGASTAGAQSGTPGGKPSQAERLIALARPADLFLARDGETACASVTVNKHRETWALRSRGFRLWLTHQFYISEGRAPGGDALRDALNTIDAQARFRGVTHDVCVRIGAHQGAVYLDLVNADWQAVEVTPRGWRVITNPPVRFRRAKGMQPLPFPMHGGALTELRGFLNVGDGDEGEARWKLVAAWLVAAMRPTGPYPVLVFGGEQGSAKSSGAKVLRRLIDPNVVLLRAEPRDGRDLMIAALNGWVISLDNVSELPNWLSNALCRLSSGGGFGTRELFTDNEETLFEAQRPVILTGIENIVTRSDLLERALLPTLPKLEEDDRRAEREFWTSFDKAYPRLLGALLDVVSTALARIDTVELPGLPRMADFAMWIEAAASALGWDKGDFVEVYADHQTSAHELALEASLLAPVVRAFAAEKTFWEGTASELLELLTARVLEAMRREPRWPKDGARLSGALRRLAPNLRAVGVRIEFQDRRERGAARRQVVIQFGPLGAAKQRSRRSERSVAGPGDGSGSAGNAGNAPGRPPAADEPSGPTCDACGAAGSPAWFTRTLDGRRLCPQCCERGAKS